MIAFDVELYYNRERRRQLRTVDGDVSRLYYQIGNLVAHLEQASNFDASRMCVVIRRVEI